MKSQRKPKVEDENREMTEIEWDRMTCTHWSRQKGWSKVADTFLIVIEKEIFRFVQREEEVYFAFFFREKLATSVHIIYAHNLAFKVTEINTSQVNASWETAWRDLKGLFSLLQSRLSYAYAILTGDCLTLSNTLKQLILQLKLSSP